MRILNAYITHDFLVTFLITLMVFLFVMAVGNIFKVIDLFSRGVSGMLILQVFSYGIPFSLIFAIPMSVLAAVFLQFSRMASDREIVALKACGVSVWQILQPPLLISTILCGLCVYINCQLAPDSHFARRKVLGRVGLETPLSLLDEGRFIRDFPGYAIYIGGKRDNRLSDIVIYEFGDRGLSRTIRAYTGQINTNAAAPSTFDIVLRQVRIDQADEQDPRIRPPLYFDEYSKTINVAEMMNKDVVWKKRADLTFSELIQSIRGNVAFIPADFIDVDDLVQLLDEPKTTLAMYLQAHLSESVMTRVEDYDGSDAARAAVRESFAQAFNLLISSRHLYDPALFKGVGLSEQTTKLLALNPQGPMLLRLNRMLLEDSFPQQINRNMISSLNPEEYAVHRMSLLVEASTRLALSFSCYAFVLLGVALGVKIHRKESSIGIGVTLLLVFIFYFFIIIADSLVNYPQLQPHLIVWIPFVVSEALGFFLIQRSN